MYSIIMNIMIPHIITFTNVPNSGGITESFIITVTDPWGAKDITSFNISVIYFRLHACSSNNKGEGF